MKATSRELIRREDGYEIWRETSFMKFTVAPFDNSPDPEGAQEFADELQALSGQEVTLEVAYSPTGAYIGDEKIAKMLCEKHGITPEVLPGHKVCSIGFCEKDNKWYGWSHRAICGFICGDIAKEGDCVCSSGWTAEHLAEHPEDDVSLPVGFEAKSIADAKRMAIAFAESVG